MVRHPRNRGATAAQQNVAGDGPYDAIKAMILDHEISPGEHVSIDELARDLGISQTPVREALARLEADGLVTKVRYRGYQSTPLLTVHQFDELFQFRGIVESWAAGEAARRSTRRNRDALQAELERARQIRRSDSPTAAYSEFTQHDSALHTLIARASGNAFVEEAFVRTHCHLHLLRVYRATVNARREFSNPIEGDFVQDLFAEYYNSGVQPLALTEHVAIVETIESGDSELARDLMLNHIESSRRLFAPAVEALNSLE